jgi:hypothetical protein
MLLLVERLVVVVFLTPLVVGEINFGTIDNFCD